MSLRASIYSSKNIFLKWLNIIFNGLYLFNNVFSCSQHSITKYIKFLPAIFCPYSRWDGLIASSSLLSDKCVSGLAFKVSSISVNEVVNSF